MEGLPTEPPPETGKGDSGRREVARDGKEPPFQPHKASKPAPAAFWPLPALEPLLSRWKERAVSWTEAFASGPRNDLIGILADRALEVGGHHLDPEGPVVRGLLERFLPGGLEPGGDKGGDKGGDNDKDKQKDKQKDKHKDRQRERRESPAKQELLQKFPFYGQALDAVKYHRDSYLMGPDYANRKLQQQEQELRQHPKDPREPPKPPWREPQQLREHQPPPKRLLPLRFGGATAPGTTGGLPLPPLGGSTSTSTAYPLLVDTGGRFLESRGARDRLLPIVVGLPSTEPLGSAICSTVSNAIPLAAPPLDEAVKQAVLGVMGDPFTRELIKSRTQQILRVDDGER